MFDEVDTAELMDLRLGSGVVRADDGVTLFRGIWEGEVADRGFDKKGSGCGVGGVWGIGGALGMMDILFILRASVGLMVRAPKPVACGAATDILLLDKGEFVLGPADLPGERPALIDAGLDRSRLAGELARLSLSNCGGASRDLALMSRFAVRSLGVLTCAPSTLPEKYLPVPWFESSGPEGSFEKSLLAKPGFGRLAASSRASVGRAPIPIDFLGGRHNTALVAGTGKWLCRRALSAKGALGGPIISIFAFAGTPRCALLLCRCKSDPLRAIFDGLAVGPIALKVTLSPVPLLINRLPMGPRSSTFPPPLGTGNSLRLSPPDVVLV